MWATFRVGESLLALESGAVREFLRHLETTPVPLGPPCLEGLANLRGVVVPVIALGTRLGLDGGASGERDPVVVVETRAGPLGWRIDEIAGACAAPDEPLDELPDSAPSELRAAVLGVGRVGGSVAFLLDPEACSRLGAEGSSVRE